MSVDLWSTILHYATLSRTITRNDSSHSELQGLALCSMVSSLSISCTRLSMTFCSLRSTLQCAACQPVVIRLEGGYRFVYRAASRLPYRIISLRLFVILCVVLKLTLTFRKNNVRAYDSKTPSNALASDSSIGVQSGPKSCAANASRTDSFSFQRDVETSKADKLTYTRLRRPNIRTCL